MSMVWSMMCVLRAKSHLESNGAHISQLSDLGFETLHGQCGRCVVTVFVVLYQFSTNCAYFTFMTTGLVSLVPSGPTMGEWTLILGAALLAPCSLKNIKELGTLSRVAIVGYGAAWAIVIVFSVERLAHGKIYNAAPRAVGVRRRNLVDSSDLGN